MGAVALALLGALALGGAGPQGSAVLRVGGAVLWAACVAVEIVVVGPLGGTLRALCLIGAAGVAVFVVAPVLRRGATVPQATRRAGP